MNIELPYQKSFKYFVAFSILNAILALFEGSNLMRAVIVAELLLFFYLIHLEVEGYQKGPISAATDSTAYPKSVQQTSVCPPLDSATYSRSAPPPSVCLPVDNKPCSRSAPSPSVCLAVDNKAYSKSVPQTSVCLAVDNAAYAKSAPPPSVRLAPVDNSRFAPQESVRLAPQGNVRLAPQSSVRLTPQESVRLAPQESVRLAPQGSVRLAPQGSSTGLNTAVTRSPILAGSPMANSIPPADIITHPMTKIVFNAPFDDKHTYHVKIINTGSRRIGWAIKTNNLKRLAVDPPYGVLDGKEAVLMAVSCDAFNAGSEDNNDRITIEWANAPEGADKKFRFAWFKGDGMVRRKNLPIVYNS